MRHNHNEINIVEHVDLLRNYTVKNIESIQAGMIPELLDISWSVSQYYLEEGRHRYVFGKDKYVLKVNGLRFITDRPSKKKLVYIKNFKDAVDERLVNPSLVFVNGLFIKWSDITLVRDQRYTYLYINNKVGIDPIHIDDVQIINIPFNVSYSEKHNIPYKETVIFRFGDNGLALDYGAIVVSTNTERINLITKQWSNLAGATIDNLDILVDKRHKSTDKNFICFTESKLNPTIKPDVKNLNLVSINDGNPIDKDLVMKYFYRAVVNDNQSNIVRPPNDDIMKSALVDNTIKGLDLHTMQKDFDYEYRNDTEYNDNFLHGIRYISRYNGAFFDELYEKLANIYSDSYTGNEFKSYIGTDLIFRMPRGLHDRTETFVMIHRNGELWDLYNRIKYIGSEFQLQLTQEEYDDIQEYDTFEIVRFSRVNNNFLKVQVPNTDTIENTTIPYEDLIVFANYTDNHIYYDCLEFTKNSLFDAPFTIDKEAKTISFTDANWYGKDIYMASKRQFRYAYYPPVNFKRCTFYLTKDFVACKDPDRYLVFHNGRMLSKDMYRFLFEEPDNSVVRPVIHTRIMADPGDIVEIFYVPDALNYVDIGTNNTAQVTHVKATIDNQPIFSIPFPTKSFLNDKNSFFVMRGSVILEQSRYDVIGDKIIMKDPSDYLPLGRELTFVFIFNKSLDVDTFGGVKEEDILTVDARFTYAESVDDIYYDIPYPYEGYNGFFFVSYRGLYVNPSRYTIEDGGRTIRFRNNDLHLDPNTAMVFVFVYPTNKYTLDASAVRVTANIENQTKFTVPVPYGDYFKDGNEFFVIRNGIFLDTDDYIVDPDTNTMTLTSPYGLDIGQELVFNFMVGNKVSVKNHTITIRATKDDQQVFKLPEVFHDYNKRDNKFFLVIGDTLVDKRRYVIDGDDLRFLGDDDKIPYGREIDFIFVYCQPIDDVTGSIGDMVDTSKYGIFTSKATTIATDGQRDIKIPFEETLLYDHNFFVTIGSTFIDSSNYTINNATGYIKFINDNIKTVAGREVLFTLIDSKYAVVEKDISITKSTMENQMDFDIVLPFDNYFEQGNKCLVFVDNVYLDPSRYTIDEKRNRLSLVDFDDALPKDKNVVFMYLYVANNTNKSYSSEEVQHPKLTEYGYIYLDKKKIKHNMNSKLFFLYVNGKKVVADTIVTPANNIIRLTEDPQTRFNAVIMDYTPRIADLEPYKNIRSDYDTIINSVDLEDVDKMWDIYTKVSDIEGHKVPNISQEAIVNHIIREHYIASGVNKGLPFIYTYDTSTLKNKQINEVKEITHRFTAPGSYSFTVPEGITKLSIQSISGSSKVDVFSNRTTNPLSNAKVGEASYLIPQEKADDFNKLIKCIFSISQPRSNNGVAQKGWAVGLNPKEGTYGISADPNILAGNLVIQTIKTMPKIKYKVTAPKGGFVCIGFNKNDGKRPKYIVDYKSFANAGWFPKRLNTDTNMYEEIPAGEDKTISYDNVFTWDEGESIFEVPEGVTNMTVALCSGFEGIPALNDSVTHVSKMAAIQIVGYGINKFSVPELPDSATVERIDIYRYYNASTSRYGTASKNTTSAGIELDKQSDFTKFGKSTYTEAPYNTFDQDTLANYSPTNMNNDEYAKAFTRLTNEGVVISVSRGVEGVSNYLDMRVEPGERFMVVVGKGATSNGALSITYDNLVPARESNLYIMDTFNASREVMTHPDLDYATNDELVLDDLRNRQLTPVSEEDKLNSFNSPTFIGSKPEASADEYTNIEEVQTTFTHDSSEAKVYKENNWWELKY